AAALAGRTPPEALAVIEPSATAKAIAASLSSGTRKGVFLGNLARQHPHAAELHALAQALCELTGARLGFLTEAANTVGGYLAGALPKRGGLNARALLGADGTEPRRAYILLHTEPELDSAYPVAARASLAAADFVVALSPFRSLASDYADVLLPIAPFTETAGTFVNGEGRAQGFSGVVPPLGGARPGWKVLRVLGTLLGLPGFDYDSVETVRAELPMGDIAARLSNEVDIALQAPAEPASDIERVADVPIYFTDPLV